MTITELTCGVKLRQKSTGQVWTVTGVDMNGDVWLRNDDPPGVTYMGLAWGTFRPWETDCDWELLDEAL